MAWNHLISQYVQFSGAREYQLLIHSLSAKQENRTIQEFHTQMRGFWRELQQLEGTEPDSSNSRALRGHHQLFMFLMALRLEFQPLCGQIIHRDHVPSLDSAIFDLVAEKTRLHSFSTFPSTPTSGSESVLEVAPWSSSAGGQRNTAIRASNADHTRP